MDRYIPVIQYDRDTAQTNARLSTIENRTIIMNDRVNRIDSQFNTTTADINYYREIICKLQKRIEALEKHTGINISMPTRDELMDFL